MEREYRGRRFVVNTKSGVSKLGFRYLNIATMLGQVVRNGAVILFAGACCSVHQKL
jgi:hypothetical protein